MTEVKVDAYFQVTEMCPTAVVVHFLAFFNINLGKAAY